MRTVAFYLPQFHEIPENNEWWGHGFTEWTNVRRAVPQFAGHDHPRQPTVLGEYDLTDPGIYRAQSDLASGNGVDAFCMYFYWFDGQRLLERPIEAWRQDATLLPYCLSWANESWTRRWDGKDKHVLMPQTYGPGYAEQLFAELLPHFRAPHYIHQFGSPVLVVHRADLIPDAQEFVSTMRGLALANGLSGIHLIAAETKAGLRPDRMDFDAVAEFPPVGANTLSAAHVRPLISVNPRFRGRFMSYERIAQRFERRRTPGFTRYRGVMPSWDNTARRKENATIYVGASPARYGRWLETARRMEIADRGDDGLVFINAWNEWAEGAYLEPDESTGLGYLRATRGDAIGETMPVPLMYGKLWSFGHLRSLAYALAGTILAVVRRVRATVSRVLGRASFR